MLGKWHVTPLTESGATGPFDGGPLGRGFGRSYGFLGSGTYQYCTEPVMGNTGIDPPRSFATRYHLTANLVDQSIRFLVGHVAERPDTPWLLWLALGATHAPHQAPLHLIKSYNEILKNCWDVERVRRVTRQKYIGIVPNQTVLPRRRDGVGPSTRHNLDEQLLFTHMQSAFAAMPDYADQTPG